MRQLGWAKILLLVAIAFLVLSIVLSIGSLFPESSGTQSNILINDTFNLGPNETYTQGLGSFQNGENMSLIIQYPTGFQENLFFSLKFPSATDFVKTDTGYMQNDSKDYFSILTKANVTYITYNNTTANYYEAVFVSNATKSNVVHFQGFVEEPKTFFAVFWLNETSKIMFLSSLSLIMLLTLKIVFSNFSKVKAHTPIPSLSKKNRKFLAILLLVSLIIWFSILAVNSNPLATFENWYTDHARDTYVSSLFLKDGLSVFSQPLNELSSLDASSYKFVTWPEMPHLYPLGSIFLFLPFGALIQNGSNASLVYKIEIAIFLIFASACVYYFLKNFLQKDMALLLKLGGVYVIYVSLVVYAMDGMFDSIAFLFVFFAVSMFLMERYDYFFLLIAVAVFFKYQAGIFLLPLIIVGVIKLFEKEKFGLLRNKAVIAGIAFGVTSVFTAFLSASYLLTPKQQFITNCINAFAVNSQLTWELQSSAVLLTLAVTLTYAVYMLKKNSLLSLLAFFMLLPSFMLPYFQNWYLPFFFIYALIPQRKKESEITLGWLIFMIVILSFGDQILGGVKTLLLSN
jgi:hypothetical protein